MFLDLERTVSAYYFVLIFESPRVKGEMYRYAQIMTTITDENVNFFIAVVWLAFKNEIFSFSVRFAL